MARIVGKSQTIGMPIFAEAPAGEKEPFLGKRIECPPAQLRVPERVKLVPNWPDPADTGLPVTALGEVS
jgi:hypothetical protein